LFPSCAAFGNPAMQDAHQWRCCATNYLPEAKEVRRVVRRQIECDFGVGFRSANPSYSLHGRDSLTGMGLVQNWGSGGNCGWRERVVGWMESLSEFGTERTIIDRTPNLKQ